MTKLQLRPVIVRVTLALATVVAAAKIAPPKPVVPVEANGVRYSADRDGSDQYAVASDIATGKQLWKVKVFHTHIKFWIEEDVQWVFITDLKLMDNSLFVRDGKARCYAVDINSHRVRKAPCSVAFGQQERASE
jgi:outer membrane protein assembly factor BamB